MGVLPFLFVEVVHVLRRSSIESSMSSIIDAVVDAMGAAVITDSVDSVVFLSSTGVLSLVFVSVSDEKHTLGLGGRGPDLWLTCHSVSNSGCIIRAIWQMV
jgi:hypothetical protein